MASPFVIAQNAVLTFTVPTGAYTEDALGNQTPTTTTVEIKASLQQVSPTQFDLQQGIDAGETIMEGRLIDPLVLPSSVPNLGKATVNLTTEEGVETGTFTLYKQKTNPYVVGVGINFLNKIRGVYRNV